MCVFKKERGTERERDYLENYSMSYLLFWLTMVPENILFVSVPGSDWDLIKESSSVEVGNLPGFNARQMSHWVHGK